MAILGFELAEIERLIALVDNHNLEEIIIEEDGHSVRIRGPRHAELLPVASPITTTTLPTPPRRQITAKQPTAPSKQPKETNAITEDQVALTSPMVGVFYKSGKPGDPPFVTVGQRITKDQTIGLIEAMKIFSEVPAEIGGIIVALPAEDGKLVHVGTPLVILKKE